MAGKSKDPHPRCRDCSTASLWRDTDQCAHHFRKRAEEFARELDECSQQRVVFVLPALGRPLSELSASELYGVVEWLKRNAEDLLNTLEYEPSSYFHHQILQ